MNTEDSASDTPKPHAPKGRIKAKPDPMDAPHLMEAPHGKPYEPCVAKSKQSGVRCKRRPIPGGRVCIIHGGGAPQVIQAAEERLRELRVPAVIRLEELMQQKEFPSVAIAAVKDILDRDGKLGKAKETLDLTVDERKLDDEEFEIRLAAVLTKLKKH